jgi:hypothetical protein
LDYTKGADLLVWSELTWAGGKSKKELSEERWCSGFIFMLFGPQRCVSFPCILARLEQPDRRMAVARSFEMHSWWGELRI